MGKLNTNQRNAIAALLTHGTVEAAAGACGLTSRTLYNYLANDAFTAELQKRQDAILAGVVAKMTTLAGKGMAQLEGALGMVRKLEENKDGRPKVELHDAQRAADRLGHLVLSLIEGRRKQAELEEVIERIAALEAQAGTGR